MGPFLTFHTLYTRRVKAVMAMLMDKHRGAVHNRFFFFFHG